MTQRVYTGHPESLEDFTQILIDAQDEKWDAEWFMRDVCAAALFSVPEHKEKVWAEALQQTTNISHQKILRWAHESRLVSPEARAKDRSPQAQIAEARRKRGD